MHSLANVILLLYHLIPNIDGTPQLTVSAPVSPVQVGRILSIHCRVSEFEQDNGKVVISHVRKTQNGGGEKQGGGGGKKDGGEKETVISIGKTLLNDDDTRVFIAERLLLDGSVVFFLSVTDVTAEDQGHYTCTLKSSNLDQILLRESVTIDLDYFPGDTSPVCWPPQIPELIEGEVAVLNCSSEKGNPTVDITWNQGGQDMMEFREDAETRIITEGAMIYSVLRFIPRLSDNSAVFLCRITSPAFPDVKRECHVGPVTVTPNPNGPPSRKPANIVVDNDVRAGTEQRFPDIGDQSIDPKESTRPSANCLDTCSAFSSPVVYWVMATIVAGLIALTFLITGIILYIRYTRIVASSKERQFVCRQISAEDAYEQLEYRKMDKMLYMSLDKQGIKTSSDVPSSQCSVYGQSGLVHYNATPTHMRQQFS